jgi:hypothetical protein
MARNRKLKKIYYKQATVVPVPAHNTVKVHRGLSDIL